jgi:hypothetical protein
MGSASPEPFSSRSDVLAKETLSNAGLETGSLARLSRLRHLTILVRPAVAFGQWSAMSRPESEYPVMLNTIFTNYYVAAVYLRSHIVTVYEKATTLT